MPVNICTRNVYFYGELIYIECYVLIRFTETHLFHALETQTLE